jgi:hypothetical protein
MAGFIPAIHVFYLGIVRKTWMPGTRPGKTNLREHLLRRGGPGSPVHEQDLPAAIRADPPLAGVGAFGYFPEDKAIFSAFACVLESCPPETGRAAAAAEVGANP